MSGKNEDESPEPDIPGVQSSSIELIPTGDVIIRSHESDERAEKREVKLDYPERVATTSTKTSAAEEDLTAADTALAELLKSPDDSEAQNSQEKREDEDRQPQLSENREIETAGDRITTGGQLQDDRVSDSPTTLTVTQETPCPIITTSTLTTSSLLDNVDNHINDTENNSTTRSSSPTFEAISNPSSPSSCPEDPVKIGKEMSAVSRPIAPLSRSTSATTTSSITTSTTVTSASSESNLPVTKATSLNEIAGERVETSQCTNKVSPEPTFPVVSVSNKEVLQAAQKTGENLDQSNLQLKKFADTLTDTRPTETNKQESNMNISQPQGPNKTVSEPSRSSSPCCQCCCIGDCCCNCEQSDSESDEEDEEDSCAPCLRDLFSMLPFVKVRRKTNSNVAQSKSPTPCPPLEKQENVTLETHKDTDIVDKQEVVSMGGGNGQIGSTSGDRITPSSPPLQQLQVEVEDIVEVETEVVPEVSRVENVPKHKEPLVKHVTKKTEQVSLSEEERQLQVTATPETLQLQPVATAKEGKKENETFSFKGIMNLFSVYKQMLLTPTQDGEDGRETPTENVVVDRTPSPEEPRQEKPGIVTQISDPDVFERPDDSDISSVTTTGTNKRRGLKQKFKNWFNLKKTARKMRNRYKSRDSGKS